MRKRRQNPLAREMTLVQPEALDLEMPEESVEAPLPGAVWTLHLDREKLLYALFIALALVMRLWDLGVRVMSHDESLHTQFSWHLYRDLGYQHTPLMHGPFLFHATALSYLLFGDNDFTARLPVALLGVALVALPYFLRRWLGRVGALATSLGLLISPAILYYSRYIRHDIPVILWSLIVITLTFSYLESPRERKLYGIAAALSLMYATKEVAFIYTAILGLFLVGLFLERWLRSDRQVALMRFFQTAGILLVGFVAVVLVLRVLYRLFLMDITEPGTVITIQGGALAMRLLVLLIVAAVFGLLAHRALATWMPQALKEDPAFDLIILIGTLILPWLSPLVSKLIFDFNPLDYSEMGVLRSAGILFPFVALAIAIGVWWNPQRWMTAAAIFYAIFAVLFTTLFTNSAGIASGLVGSLGYWLEQQGVQRGSQPPYYYLMLVPLYEYLPIVGTLSAWFVWNGRRRRWDLVYWTAALLIIALLWLVAAFALQPSFMFTRPEPNPLVDRLLVVLPALLLFAAYLLWLNRRRFWPERETAAPQPSMRPEESRFVAFVLFWTALTWVGYTYAGEKMPWLTTHFAVPMILLTGWTVGSVLQGVNWRRAWREGLWGVVLAALLLVPALVQILRPFFLAPAQKEPFLGRSLEALRVTGQWLTALAVAVGMIVWLYRLWRRLGGTVIRRTLYLTGMGLLALLTLRTAWMFAYINYDYPTEYMVYAHGGADVKLALRRIEQISKMTVGDRLIKVAYGEDGSWPFHWYFRESQYPNAVFYGKTPSREQMEAPIIIAGQKEWNVVEPYLGDKYISFTYTYLWWPNEGYRGMTWDRIRNAIVDPVMRAAVWDIIFNRDYRKYAAAIGKEDLVLSNWDPHNAFKLYIRKDLAAKVWDLGPGVVTAPPTEEEENPYAGLERIATAIWVRGSEGSGPGQFRGPRGLALGDDGTLYVADANNHRIVALNQDGEFLFAFGSRCALQEEGTPGCVDPDGDGPLAVGDGQFNEPWGVGVGPEGHLYVADTWNHRIQVFTSQGEFLTKWGVLGQVTTGVGGEGLFYGPRDVVVSSAREVFVSDTGNKRIQVFTTEGMFLRQWGGGGVIEGRMDEPVGIAFNADQTALYVADTWNRRVQVFLPTTGDYLRQWSVAGWYGQSIVNKPYIAVDAQERVYVTDPERYRILVFDREGKPLAVLGRYGFDETSFALPTGIAVDAEGNIYVSDAVGNRILKFPPLEAWQPSGE